jgi:hypothetical protein
MSRYRRRIALADRDGRHAAVKSGQPPEIAAPTAPPLALGTVEDRPTCLVPKTRGNPEAAPARARATG